MNIPMFVINASMVLGGVGMLGYVLWWVLEGSNRVFDWLGQVFFIAVWSIVGLALIVIGLGLR